MKKSKKQPKHKHTPLRTCVGCREIHTKKTLIRIVRQENGVFIDSTGKMPGRGAYLHQQKTCWEKGIKGALSHALRTTLTSEDIERLNEFTLTFTDE